MQNSILSRLHRPLWNLLISMFIWFNQILLWCRLAHSLLDCGMVLLPDCWFMQGLKYTTETIKLWIIHDVYHYFFKTDNCNALWYICNVAIRYICTLVLMLTPKMMYWTLFYKKKGKKGFFWLCLYPSWKNRAFCNIQILSHQILFKE